MLSPMWLALLAPLLYAQEAAFLSAEGPVPPPGYTRVTFVQRGSRPVHVGEFPDIRYAPVVMESHRFTK